MSTCAIVILNYNGKKVLPTFLPSVVKHSTYEVWLIDNASTDDSLDYVKEEFPEVKLISLSSNFGFAGGYNWGLEQLKGQYDFFILLNSDVEVTPHWDKNLIDWLQSKEEFAAIQPKILSWQNRPFFDYAGAGGGYLDSFGYPYCRGRIWDTLEEDLGQYDDAIQTDWATGACLVIRASDFFEVEGFDAHFFAHMEEIDLCWRLRRIGRKIGYLGSVKVYHLGGATLDRASPAKLQLNIRNNLSMLYKNSGRLKFFAIVLVKVILELLASILYLFLGKKEEAKAVLNGYVDFWKQRGLFLPSKKEPELEIPSSGPVKFVFWNYFILRRKKFSQL